MVMRMAAKQFIAGRTMLQLLQFSRLLELDYQLAINQLGAELTVRSSTNAFHRGLAATDKCHALVLPPNAFGVG